MNRVSTLDDHNLEKAELGRILGSRPFLRAPTLSKMLAYICEKHFVGQADRIKEYNIAVEALGRGSDFDSGGDSIVRVEAARLRKHLERYYATEGAGSILRLRVAGVGYAPRFETVAPPEALDFPALPDAALESEPVRATAGDEAQNQAAVPRRHSRMALAVTLAIAGILGIGLLAGAYLRTRPVSASRVQPPRDPPASGELWEIRIHAGSSVSRFLDTSGASWLNDSYFSGGAVFSRADRQIVRTYDQSLYQTGREGDFSYAIPLNRGVYELRLHFAETSYGQIRTIGAEKLRIFDVSINGAPLLSGFDITTDAGGANTADEKIFKDVSPAQDGSLHLGFSTKRNGASLNGIEILPGIPGKALPIRIVCGPRAYYDHTGRLWRADRYFSGGRQDEGVGPVHGAEDPGLYSHNRWGHFTYAIPVADGTYRLTLRFAETYWRSNASGGNNGRLFDVHCNGKALVNRLDIYKEAGGENRALELTYRGLKPNAQNKLVLSFVPILDYAILSSIEVEDENL